MKRKINMDEFKDGRNIDGGSEFWFKDGKPHREDGPAIEWTDGSKFWYVNGNELTEEEFNQWLEKKQLNERLHQELEEKPVVRKPKI